MLRFQGWPWLLSAALLPLLLIGVLGSHQGLHSEQGQCRALWLAALLAAVLALIAIVRVWRPLYRLLQQARDLSQGRGVAADLAPAVGINGALSEQLKTVATQLSDHRDHLDRMVEQTTTQLRGDQADLQTLNQELQHALDEAKTAARAQSELMANLSHELRTPLTAILGYTDLLHRSGLNREQESHIATVGKSARGMLSMINDLLDWSRIEAGHLQLNTDTFDVTEVVEDVTALLAPLAYDKDLELVRVVYHDVPPRLQGDAQRLRQILINLLSNAIKFTTQGEVVLKLMREREDDARVWLNFSISDTGPGISEAQQRRLFQPFQQVAGTHGGSGLGLMITRRLVERMGGAVSMHSVLGEGATFSANIPFDAAEAPPAETVEPVLRERVAWIVEPNLTAGRALSHWLEFWEMKVRNFDDVAALSAALENSAPDVVIVGLKEADAESPAHLYLLRQCQWRKPPLIALIASASLDVQARVREAGAAICAPKSISQYGLLRELAGLINLKSTRQQPLAGRRVLIADNNDINRLYIATLCRELALQVEEAVDGREALQRWRAAPMEFVLLDVRMPEIGGLECTRAIRAETLPGGRRSRIIAVSAHLEPGDRKALLSAGADEVLLKPFDHRALLRALAPQLLAAPPPVSALLANDPQMQDLLRDELPLQLVELEQALQKNDLAAARDAAHQLRGSAAFYHLSSLRDATSTLDLYLLQLNALDDDLVWSDMLDEVRQALTQALQQLEHDPPLMQ